MAEIYLNNDIVPGWWRPYSSTAAEYHAIIYYSCLLEPDLTMAEKSFYFLEKERRQHFQALRSLPLQVTWKVYVIVSPPFFENISRLYYFTENGILCQVTELILMICF